MSYNTSSEPPTKKNRTSESSDLLCLNELPSPIYAHSSSSYCPHHAFYSIRLQQSLLTPICFYFIEHIWYSSMSSSTSRHPKESLRISTDQLITSIRNVAFLSKRFHDSFSPSLKKFFETHTFPVTCQTLPRLFSLASFFGAMLRSVNLKVFYDCRLHHVAPFSPIIHGLERVNHYTDIMPQADPQFFYHPLLLPHLRRLSFTTSRLDRVIHRSIMESGNIEELDLTLNPRLLVNVFLKGKCSLRKIKITSQKVSDLKLYRLFTVISKSTTIEVVDLENVSTNDLIGDLIDDSLSYAIGPPPKAFTAFAPLLNSPSLKNLILPRCRIDSGLFRPLQNNLILTELNLLNIDLIADDIAEVLKFNTALKKLLLQLTPSSISPIFKSLEFNNSLVDLVIHSDRRYRESYRKTFVEEEVQSLIGMVQKNTGLLVLSLDGSLFNSFNSYQLFVQALVYSHNLEHVNIMSASPSLRHFVTDFELFSLNYLRFSINLSPHFLDIVNGVFASLQNGLENTSRHQSPKKFYS
ncbi:hypothetical protein GEMRC1_010195 [Eukaryota sp. GEM-RC1]